MVATGRRCIINLLNLFLFHKQRPGTMSQ
uniref:Uncharacterized protein n=1 Tax=Rhizophora mucronata TaxID=61149 RepID=A0A2P2PK84_RHIMU